MLLNKMDVVNIKLDLIRIVFTRNVCLLFYVYFKKFMCSDALKLEV